MLDAIAQRVLGVLAEKEVTVPDSYPLTESALLAGCNQKSNRDPEMALELTDVRRTLDTLRADGWVVRMESSGGRAPRFRHEIGTQIGVDGMRKAIIIELLVRGPQAPGALRGRMGRFGLDVTTEQITAALQDMSQGDRALVRELPRRPRERDNRWCHLLGDPAEIEAAGAPEPSVGVDAPPPMPRPEPAAPDLADRVRELEDRVARLEDRLDEIL